MRAILKVGLAGAALTFAGQAFAQDRSKETIAWLDRDADGRVSLNEYLNFQAPRLKQYDENGNDRLSRAEFEASLSGAGKSNADRSFRAFDGDKNKALDQREFLGYHAYVFKNFLDGDRDEFLTVEELAAVAE